MKSKWTWGVVVGLAGLAVYAANVLATPQSGFTPVQQWKGIFDEMNVHVVDMPRHQVKLKTKGSPMSTSPRTRSPSAGRAGGTRIRARA